MTAEHAHGIDTGGEVEPLLIAAMRRRPTGIVHHSPEGVGGTGTSTSGFLRELDEWEAAIHVAAADAVLAEARQLCCGNNPSAHHEATAKHSERMAFAGDLARAVRQG